MKLFEILLVTLVWDWLVFQAGRNLWFLLIKKKPNKFIYEYGLAIVFTFLILSGNFLVILIIAINKLHS